MVTHIGVGVSSCKTALEKLVRIEFDVFYIHLCKLEVSSPCLPWVIHFRPSARSCAIREELHTTWMGSCKDFLHGLQIHLMYLYTNLLEGNKGKVYMHIHTTHTQIHLSYKYTLHIDDRAHRSSSLFLCTRVSLQCFWPSFVPKPISHQGMWFQCEVGWNRDSTCPSQ